MNNIRLSIFLTLFILLVSCTSDQEKTSGCVSNSECYNDRICHDGICQEDFDDDVTLIEDISVTDAISDYKDTSDIDASNRDTKSDSHENDTNVFVCPEA